MTKTGIIGHCLIGLPASGKSTFSHLLQRLYPDVVIISTDHIREELYGDESIQGEWKEIERLVLQRITEAVQHGRSTIYDATNFKRSFRLDFLEKLSPLSMNWIGWWLQTSENVCYLRNNLRKRQVFRPIIQIMSQDLQQFPPISAEGFTVVYPIHSKITEEEVLEKMNHLETLQNYPTPIQFHRYSKLIDFERLMYLISILIHSDQSLNLPSLFFNLLEHKDRETLTLIQKITHILGEKHGEVFANFQAIQKDLHWLGINQFFTDHQTSNHFVNLEVTPPVNFIPHAYSESYNFTCLMMMIRYLTTHLMNDHNLSNLETIITEKPLFEEMINILKVYHFLPI